MAPLAAAGFVNAVQDGPLLVAAGVALLVGVIGFLSPCVLPLVPGYLSYVAGLSGSAGSTPNGSRVPGSPVDGATADEGDSAAARGAGGGVAVAQRRAPRPVADGQRRMVAGALLFVLGFSLIFVLGGVVFGSLGASVRDHTTVIARWLGAVTIVMGVVFLGGLGFLQRELKIHRLPAPGLLGAPLLGLAFGAAWTPCLTPTFGAVYSMSLTEGTAGRGAFLMACYCLGLGIPFVLVALGVGWVSGALTFVRRHMRVVSGVGGLALIVIGVLLVTGEWTSWMAQLRLTVGPGSGIAV